jgi:tetratricopeptide (TPR) repeat protein
VQADPRSPERGQYGFLQDLVRTVAYETLSKRDRKQKHLAAARYLETAWGGDEDEIAEVVAAHYVDAHRLAPDADDAREIGDKARRMLVRAGERAASLAAVAEARAHFEQASGLSDSPLLRAELYDRVGRMALLEANAEVSAASFEEATRLFEEAGQTHAAARVQASFAQLDFTSGRIEQAVERSRSAYDVLAGDEPDPDLAHVAGQLGRFLAISGRYDEAGAPLEEALLLAEQRQPPEVYSNGLSSKAIVFSRVGRLDEATTLLRRAIDVALEHDLIDAATRAQNNLGVIWEAQDRFAPLIELTDEALALIRRSGNRVTELGWLSGAIGTYLALGRWDEALARAEEIEAAADFGTFEWAIGSYVEIVPVLVRRGDLGRARETLDSLGQLAKSDSIEVRAGYGCAAAETLRAEGRPAEALDVAREILALRPQLGLGGTAIKRALVQAVEAALASGDTEQADDLLGIVRGAKPGEISPYSRAHAARLASRIAALRGEPELVEQGFEAAARGFREIEMPFELAVSLLEHAEWLAEQGRESEAEPLLDEARSIFARLEAEPWLARIAQAARTGPLEAM